MLLRADRRGEDPHVLRVGEFARAFKIVRCRTVDLDRDGAEELLEERSGLGELGGLLTRSLPDVLGENDPTRRRAAIDEIFTEDCVFYEPRCVYRGRDEIYRVAGEIKATHPDFRYQPIAGPEELGNGGRIQRGIGPPG